MSDVATCKANVMAAFERVSECMVIEQAEIDAALARCETGAFDLGIRAFWRPDFAAEFDACYETLRCEELNDADDICFPIALEALADGLLSVETIAECIVGQSTAACESALANHSEPNTNAVANCFRRWSECEPDRINTDPYWTEDYCGTVLALQDQYRAQADACLARPCTEISGCMADAGAFNY